MFFIICLLLFLFPSAATRGAEEGLKVAFETVIPAILPFSVFSSALIYSGSAVKIGKVLAPLWQWMGLNPYGAVAFLSGLLGGYPTGCKAVCDMCKENIIDRNEAERMLSYCNNGGIIFAMNICGKAAFGSIVSGIMLFTSGAVAALITGAIMSADEKKSVVYPKSEKPPLMAVLGKSIASGGEVIINIAAAFVVFYAILNIPFIEKLPYLAGIMEVTKGIMLSGKMNNLPLASLFFSFGGICVFAQSAAICASLSIRLKKYFTGKVISSVISFFITYMAVNLFHSGKDIILFSLLVTVGVICAIKLIKRVYA